MEHERQTSDPIALVYVHDPMCSWCWGFRPALERLRARLPTGVTLTGLLGGLAPDSSEAMPIEMQARLQATWRRIQRQLPGTRFNFEFWRLCRPRRSTWLACRAVIAARTLDRDAEPVMIHAIQRAYYLEARNPSDAQTLIGLAGGMGLDASRFARLLDAARTRDTLAGEIALARRIGADSFPSLRLRIDGQYWPVPIDYTQVEPMLETIRALIDLERPPA